MFQFMLPGHNPSLREVRAGTETDCGGALFTGLLPLACSATFLHSQTHLPRMVPSTVGWALPASISNQESIPQTYPSQSDGGNTLMEVPFSGQTDNRG